VPVPLLSKAFPPKKWKPWESSRKQRWAQQQILGALDVRITCILCVKYRAPEKVVAVVECSTLFARVFWTPLFKTRVFHWDAPGSVRAYPCSLSGATDTRSRVEQWNERKFRFSVTMATNKRYLFSCYGTRRIWITWTAPGSRDSTSRRCRSCSFSRTREQSRWEIMRVVFNVGAVVACHTRPTADAASQPQEV